MKDKTKTREQEIYIEKRKEAKKIQKWRARNEKGRKRRRKMIIEYGNEKKKKKQRKEGKKKEKERRTIRGRNDKGKYDGKGHRNIDKGRQRKGGKGGRTGKVNKGAERVRVI